MSSPVARRAVFSAGCALCAVAAGVLISHALAWVILGVGALAVGASLKPMAERLPSVAVERGDGLALRVRAPQRVGRRSLHRRTEKLVHDWHRYCATWQGGGRPEDHAAYEEALKAYPGDFFDIWSEEDARKDERVYRWRDECELVFRERVVELEAEYRRRGLLEANELTQFPEGELPYERFHAGLEPMKPDPLPPAVARLEQLGGIVTELP